MCKRSKSAFSPKLDMRFLSVRMSDEANDSRRSWFRFRMLCAANHELDARILKGGRARRGLAAA